MIVTKKESLRKNISKKLGYEGIALIRTWYFLVFPIYRHENVKKWQKIEVPTPQKVEDPQSA